MKKTKMKDVQNFKNKNGIDIDRVGISRLKYPIQVLDRKNKKQQTTAEVNISVNLPRHFKGTHMSRFVEILNEYRGEITIRNMGDILRHIAEKLNAQSAHMDISYLYFIEKSAPISKQKSFMDYKCRFIGSYSNGEDDFILEVKVPILTLCPCSKEISDYGAHNQRSEVTVQIRFNDFVWIEDIVKIVESVASSDLYTLLKRSDEKYVTEKSYDNPRFVEDIVRLVSKKLLSNKNITWFKVESQNFESIHNHNAFAIIERDKRK